MKAWIIFLFTLGSLPCMGAENPLYTWDLLWTGSWYRSIKTPDGELPPSEGLFSGGTLFNRGNLALGLPKQKLSFRFMATDKRVLPPVEDDGKSGFNPGLGIYHDTSGSRFLQGVQSEYGLPARINNVWLRGAPFMESRSPSFRDFKTEPAAKDKAESYLYLALPRNILPGFGAFASAALDGEQNPAFTTGIDLSGVKAEFRIEGFFTERELPPRKISTWFSAAPPLPERDFRIYALGFIFNSPIAAFAGDWAWSETFAWGRGLYGNFALRLGNKPWRFSLAGDGAGSRFADRSGSTAGSAFRLAAKGERFWTRSGLLRFQGVFRAPAVGGYFERGSLSVYLRPSAPSAKEMRESRFPVRFSRASLGLNRDARTPEKTADTLNGLVGFNFGPLGTVFSCTLNSCSILDDAGGIPPLFQPLVFETFESFKVSGELRLSPGIFDIRARLGYTTRTDKPPLWEPSLNCSIRPVKWGRVGLRIASTDFPEKWDYTLSWRFSGKR